MKREERRGKTEEGRGKREEGRGNREGGAGNGFTLVEIALAMLVFAVGILSFFALLSAGLDQGNRARHQTECAIFADGVLGGLRAISEDLSETAVSNEWAVFWEAMRDGTTNVTVAAGGTNGMWLGDLVVRGGDATYTNVYTNYSLHVSDVTNIVNHIVHYRLNVDVTNALESIPWSSRAMVTLKVWEGGFGTAHDQDSVLFYTEYGDRGAVR